MLAINSHLASAPSSVFNAVSSRIHATHVFKAQRLPVHRHHPCLAAGKGFGKSSEAAQQRERYQDEVKTQRSIQLAATDIIAKLVAAEEASKGGAAAVAEDYVDSLNEEFFQIGGAYLQMAKKEGDDAVSERLERALKAAMAAKQATLRPEIQLLNGLLAAETELQRKQVLNTKLAGEVLVMNDKYFWTLLENFTRDVGLQPEGEQREVLVRKLGEIKQSALDRLPPGTQI